MHLDLIGMREHHFDWEEVLILIVMEYALR